MKSIVAFLSVLFSVTCGHFHATAASGLVGKVPRFNDSNPQKPKFTFDELWELEVKFWDNFLYPANLKEAQTINSTFFTPDVQGRVDITRNFDGAEMNTEYLFGLFTDPTHVNLVGVPVSYEIVEFAANDNIASASTIIMFNSTTFGTSLPVTIDTFIAWNTQGQIWQYDATFRWFGFLLDTIISTAGSRTNATTPDKAKALVANLLASSLCQTHQTYCNGTNQQYSSPAECFDFLTQSVRFGQAYELGRNTLLCRSVHEQMIQYRPSVHCPHIGPSGGNMCVDDQGYAEKVLQKYFTNTRFIPDA
ncbi:hypothetical protein N7530_010663 [Penicillium desertorum]|uniref:Uncharacterized protein n=1 Tax=Penicillium desertorum TaxID=1303715 RepID=A0A9X0BHY1_9EURO|nr:hypothetical protein N7530_010663 [Penicillium desertorum]